MFCWFGCNFWDCIQLFDFVVQSQDMTDTQKARITERLAEADKVNPSILKYQPAPLVS
jgi:hypothetical protein